MKLMIVVVLALVALASSAAVGPTNAEPVKIIRSDFENNEKGYRFGYETADGSHRDEEGTLKDAVDEENKPHQVITVRGSYTYIDSNGQSETINYYADETGYHAEGPSIPKNAIV